MKKVSRNFQVQIVVKLFILLFSSTNFTIQIFSQTNPWENQSKENPWETSKKEESKTTKTNIDTTAFISNSEIQKITKVDSLSQAIDTTNSRTQEISIPTNNALSLKSIENISRYNYKAPAAFIGSFFTGGIFLILALPVNMIASVIPTKRSNSYVANYMTQNPKAAKDEIKAVKKGIQKKRSLNSLGGTLTGMAAGLIVWATVFFRGI